MLASYAISVQGSSHEEAGKPCQDCSRTEKIRDGDGRELVAMAIADGVGACPFSDRGASIAVNTAVDKLKNSIEEDKEWYKDPLDLIRQAFEAALTAVKETAEEEQMAYPLFDSTLTAVIYDGHKAYIGHIGDCGVVVLYADGEYELFTTRHKGAEVNHVKPLRHSELWEFVATEKETAAVLAMTDGILDEYVGKKAMNNRVFFPALKPFLMDLVADEEDVVREKEEWEAYLSTDNAFRELVRDDLTIAVARNTELIETMEEPFFDREKWDADSTAYEKEIEEFLYPSGCAAE